MERFIVAVFFLSGNFIYQLCSETPDYSVAIERTFFQAAAMLVIVFWPTGRKPN